MKIISARFETTEEKQKRLEYLSNKNKLNQDYSISYCSKNSNKIVELYEEFKIKYKSEKQIEANNKKIMALDNAKKSELIFNEVKNGIRHICQCGGFLRYIDYYNFIGCTNFKNKNIKHDSYNLPNWEELNKRDYTTEIGEKHLDIFKDRYFDKNIKLSLIYKTLKSNNVKFLSDINENRFNRLTTENRNSNIEEKIIREILTEKFNKINYQQAIKYKLENDHNYSLKIPDYICQDEKYIYVFEAKKNIINVDYSQLNFYVDLLNFIKLEKNINKEVRSFFIIFEPFNGNINNCLTIQNLKSL